MNRYITGNSILSLATLIVMIVLEGSAWSQQLETRDDHDGWLTTESSDSQVIRWRMIEDVERCSGPGHSRSPFGGTVRIEVATSGGAIEDQACAIDLGRCGCKPVIGGVYRHRGAAVAVINASYGGTTRGGVEYSQRCIFAVRLTAAPEILFQRHMARGTSGWSIPSRPLRYRFVPMHDLLMVVMEGTDGTLPWPVGEQPATQASTMATIIPNVANEVAMMPERVRSRLAPVTTVPRSTWSVLQEPFTYPPHRVVVGKTRMKSQAFSTELSYDGPQFDLKRIYGTDTVGSDPLPTADFPLADYRWKELDFGPQLRNGEVELIVSKAEREIHILRWPCTTDPHEWDQMRDYELPRNEEWVVLLDASDPGRVEARAHLVRTCLTFQVQQYFNGRGGLFRSFENGTFEEIIDNGRVVGLKIHHSRPRILTPTGANPLPDEREFFEQSWPIDDWWHPFFDESKADKTVVFRID